MGKNPVVRHGDKVLIAYSGGNNSAALLHLVKQVRQVLVEIQIFDETEPRV